MIDHWNQRSQAQYLLCILQMIFSKLLTYCMLGQIIVLLSERWKMNSSLRAIGLAIASVAHCDDGISVLLIKLFIIV